MIFKVPEREPTLYSSSAWSGSREKKRELRLYRVPDKESSQCQVSRPGQLNTESDPSTHAHPWEREREIEGGRMERGEAVTRLLSQGSLCLGAAGVLKMAKQKRSR